jgi:hypothetical protein
MNMLSKHAGAALLFLMGQGAAGCLAAPSELEEGSGGSGGSDTSEESSDTENVASTAQAITASQRTGVGKVYDTGASMGFAEFFASIINWSAPAWGTDVDHQHMNDSIALAISSRTGTYQAISSGAYNPPLPTILPKYNPAQPYATVNGWASGIRTAVASNSSYAAYYDLGRNLAVAEGQASIAAYAPQSWQYASWALDSALANANALQGRVALDIPALSALRTTVANSKPSNAPALIRTLRESYATTVYTKAEIICGDQTCDGGETCSSCPGDCGSCCGNGSCQAGVGESCLSCQSDCGACGPVCGDGQCNGSDNCSSCPGDCGACTCGNSVCEAGETCGGCVWDCGQTHSLCQYCPNGAGYNSTPITKRACSAQAALTAAQASTPWPCEVNYGACW